MRLIVASNRLPFTIGETRNGIRLQRSIGGLTSGIGDYLERGRNHSPIEDYLWGGWPGSSLPESSKDESRQKLISKRAYPVFLSKQDIEKYYWGFSNKTIWPLFHYFPSFTMFNEDYWQQYKRVNNLFCQTISEILAEEDTILIQDYHLMLLPKMLREKFPDHPIGFFLHIPFPSYEVFRLLPMNWRQEILEGLLGADIIGFHTHDYTQYFLRCIFRILGLENDMGRIEHNGVTIKADTFPLGIDFKRFQSEAATASVRKKKAKLKQVFKNRKVILSIDRLDYSKGIINRLQGYETFLRKNPQWQKRVVLLLIAAPSRIGIDQYQQMKKDIDEYIGRINGRFGSINWVPIIYQYKSYNENILSALYALGDVALITPLRDGMNLIAKEYLASRIKMTGVLILSEMAGAAKELGEAIIINPNYKEEIATAIKLALEIPKKEQIRRNEIMQKRLVRYDVFKWAHDFLKALQNQKEEQRKLKAKMLYNSIREKLLSDYRKSRKRLILLDYDGTLIPFARYPQLANPGEELLVLLKRLAADERNDVVLISGRDRAVIKRWFTKIPIHLVAEHGIWIKETDTNWFTPKALSNSWKQQILSILELYTDRLPGSFIEEKEFSIAWHYRRADPELGQLRAKELMDDLITFTANIEVQILSGNKVIEARSGGINKGTAYLYYGDKKDYDFVLAMGDDATDEDLFKVLPYTSYSIRIGTAKSYAKYYLRGVTSVINLLSHLSTIES